VPNFRDLRRAFQDEVGNELGQKRPRDVGGYVVDELRRNEHDEVVRAVLQAVFVGDAVLHGEAWRAREWRFYGREGEVDNGDWVAIELPQAVQCRFRLGRSHRA
jgi:hypothetical protein